ncbi:hypothetical protein NESM_000675300 [Novymonas esmeraldas]|uniref:Uncharacterized protein n=1 Tax=Novymonas esmeraldas TaxID=1808958 RepID=A0AAW0EUW0_9TRYP
MRGGAALRLGRVSPDAYACLLGVLRQCGVEYRHVLPERLPGDLSRSAAAPFAPLFTTQHFDAHQHHLTTLGDALVDRYLSAAVLKYTSRRGTTFTTNTAGELNAVLHNHFTLRLFAKELQFEAMQLSRDDADGGGGDASAASLHFLEAESSAVRKRDVAGTSYQVALLPCGQSPLGWKFSQFVGAVHQIMGDTAATSVLERVYQLQDESNVPRRASLLLLRTLELFPALNVAEALLAAQGLSVHFAARSRVVPGEPEMPAGTGPTPPSSTSPPPRDTGGSDERAIVAGFGADHADVTLDSLGSSSRRAATLADGPGVIDAVDVWRRRTATLVSQQLEPALPPASAATDGWLSAQERAAYERGPAFAGWVDMTATSTFADLYGATPPEDGRIVRRVKFKKQVRDPRFYDKVTDARNGVPFDTGGESLPAYLDGFATPHRRLFEVTMHTCAGGDMKVVGRAIAPRYTSARESACRAFLGGVLRDLLALGGGTVDGASETAAPQQPSR